MDGHDEEESVAGKNEVGIEVVADETKSESGIFVSEISDPISH